MKIPLWCRSAPYVVWLALAVFTLAVPAYSEDGTYDAVVTTDSGSYTVPVEVEGGEVTFVHWPNGGDMHVYGAEIADSEAQGWNSRDESVSIEIDDYPEASDEE
ncbi:MAG: hypothetical protein HY597_05500 [Candidatus Omnitrophica bacterium]|nr:hypothetical protein [Candidatus Omnitrophota bacterium]